jgi:hypothetical protein
VVRLRSTAETEGAPVEEPETESLKGWTLVRMMEMI